jgi:hypothetical protein
MSYRRGAQTWIETRLSRRRAASPMRSCHVDGRRPNVEGGRAEPDVRPVARARAPLRRRGLEPWHPVRPVPPERTTCRAAGSCARHGGQPPQRATEPRTGRGGPPRSRAGAGLCAGPASSRRARGGSASRRRERFPAERTASQQPSPSGRSAARRQRLSAGTAPSVRTSPRPGGQAARPPPRRRPRNPSRGHRRGAAPRCAGRRAR